MPASAWPSLPFCLVSSMRRDSVRISFSSDSTDLGEFGAEGRDRLFDVIGTLQRLDLARDLDQMTFQRRKVRAGRRSLHHRLGGMVLGGRRHRRGVPRRDRT